MPWSAFWPTNYAASTLIPINFIFKCIRKWTCIRCNSSTFVGWCKSCNKSAIKYGYDTGIFWVCNYERALFVITEFRNDNLLCAMLKNRLQVSIPNGETISVRNGIKRNNWKCNEKDQSQLFFFISQAPKCIMNTSLLHILSADAQALIRFAWSQNAGSFGMVSWRSDYLKSTRLSLSRWF